MKIEGIVWLGEIVEKLERKHNVRQREVREVLNGKPNFRFVEKGRRSGEDVYAALGRSVEGRYLIVFFVYKTDRRAIIVSARDMTKSERRRCEQT